MTFASANCHSPSEVVDAGTEFGLNDFSNIQLLEIDVQESSIVLSVLSGLPWSIGGGHLMISSLDWVGDPTAEIISASVTSGISGLDDSKLIIDAHSITVLYDGVSWQGGTTTINLVTTHGVPEPTTVALFGTGIARHRRRA